MFTRSNFPKNKQKQRMKLMTRQQFVLGVRKHAIVPNSLSETILHLSLLNKFLSN
jgi:hypothetical protein